MQHGHADLCIAVRKSIVKRIIATRVRLQYIHHRAVGCGKHACRSDRPSSACCNACTAVKRFRRQSADQARLRRLHHSEGEPKIVPNT